MPFSSTELVVIGLVVAAFFVVPALAAVFVADRSRRDTVALSKAILMLKGVNPHHLEPKTFAPNGASWDALNREAVGAAEVQQPPDPDAEAEREDAERKVREWEELMVEAAQKVRR